MLLNAGCLIYNAFVMPNWNGWKRWLMGFVRIWFHLPLLCHVQSIDLIHPSFKYYSILFIYFLSFLFSLSFSLFLCWPSFYIYIFFRFNFWFKGKIIKTHSWKSLPLYPKNAKFKHILTLKNSHYWVFDVLGTWQLRPKRRVQVLVSKLCWEWR